MECSNALIFTGSFALIISLPFCRAAASKHCGGCNGFTITVTWIVPVAKLITTIAVAHAALLMVSGIKERGG